MKVAQVIMGAVVCLAMKRNQGNPQSRSWDEQQGKTPAIVGRMLLKSPDKRKAKGLIVPSRRAEEARFLAAIGGRISREVQEPRQARASAASHAT